VPLNLLTLTGVDDSVSAEELEAFGADTFRPTGDLEVELGVLYRGPKPAKPRYPSEAWVRRDTSEPLISGNPRSPEWRTALHLCGDALWGDPSELHGLVYDWTVAGHIPRYRRVQLNFGLKDKDLGTRRIAEMARVVRAVSGRGIQVIVQCMGYSQGVLTQAARLAGPGGSVLLDPSGGRGIPVTDALDAITGSSHDDMVFMPTGINWGFAGGIGPENIRQVLRQAEEVAGGGWFWLDMESSLRDADDKFDLVTAGLIFSEAVAEKTASSPRWP